MGAGHYPPACSGDSSSKPSAAGRTTILALMPLPAKVTWVTFDVYGTLIDWEAGIFGAFKKEAAKDGFTIEDKDRDRIIALFHELSREVEGGSYELYAEVLRQTAVKIAKEIGWPLEP